VKLRSRELIEQGNKLFSKRSGLESRWQSIADHFYPERADFTRCLDDGDDFAGHLMSGFPSMCRRDLANQIGGMLRPRGQTWFHPRTPSEKINKDQGAKVWLDHMGETMHDWMRDSLSGFSRATKQGDHDFATFGQCVIQVTKNQNKDFILFRNWHLRDVAWAENAEMEIDRVHRKQKMEARNVVRYFGRTNGEIAATVKECASKEPFKEIPIQHIVVPADDYDLSKAKNVRRLPFVSIYVDMDNEKVLEEVPVARLGYVIPRWQTVSGSQYAHSPATVIAIPDARLLQRMTLTLLEAGEKAVDPPMLAVGEVLQGGINVYSGGVTYVDPEYDEKTGEALRALQLDKSGLQWGVDREQRVSEMIMRAFYLNQIQLPEVTGDMTAYETQKRVEEYVRNALPLFEPMESEYNARLCGEAFDVMMELGAFGSEWELADSMPEILRGQEVRFTFESPIQQAKTRANSQAFLQSSQLLAAAMQLDPNTRFDFDARQAARDAIEGTGAPANWLLPKDKADKMADQASQDEAEKAGDAETMAALGQGADVAARAGDAMSSINQALLGA
jgi:hypothetical protein